MSLIPRASALAAALVLASLQPAAGHAASHAEIGGDLALVEIDTGGFQQDGHHQAGSGDLFGFVELSSNDGAYASSLAVAEPGFLSIGAEAGSSPGEFSSATAAVRLTFALQASDSPYRLDVLIDHSVGSTGPDADASSAFQFTINGPGPFPLDSETFELTSSTALQFSRLLDLGPGLPGTLTLSLTGEASADPGDAYASLLSSVQFLVQPEPLQPVPLPAAAWLMLGGLGLLGGVARRR